MRLRRPGELTVLPTARDMNTPLQTRTLTRGVRTCCALGASLLLGTLRAQDFTYINTNGTVTITAWLT